MPDINGLVDFLESTPEAETTCERCGREASLLFHNDEFGSVCAGCDSYPCPDCGTEWTYAEDAASCCIPQYECPECGSSWEDEDDARRCCRSVGASYPSLAPLSDVYQVSVPEIEGRPGRLCSIEQEINEGGSEATQMLYDYGFAESNEQQSYSSQGRPGMVSVKSDASLSGSDSAEIVYSRYRLWEDGSVADLSLALARMRQLAREANCVRVNKSAGTHVHVSATAENGLRIGPVQVGAMHEIFAYSEDFLYSMAAAGWDAHRATPGGSGYCKPIPKVAAGQKATAFRVSTLMRGDRYFGLNFQRLLSAAGNCSCGAARFGEWQECECGAFDGATVEWRLFNASTKPETLHAWLILSHALTAMSFGHQTGTLPANGYGTQDTEGRRSVQTWIERNAPLTDDEIHVIRAAARKAPGLGKPRR